MSARTRTILRRSAALALGVLLVPLLVEVGYRALRLQGLSPTTNPAYVRHDPDLGWSYRPGTRERHRSPWFDVTVSINAQGFRGPDWPPPAPGRPRVLVLGDSFAFGWGVEQEQTFGALLALREPGWDVLDAAVSGYGTDQQRLLLERLLPTARPDVVVTVFCANDLFENVSSVVYGKLKPRFVRRDGRLELTGVPVPQPFLERWSYAARALAKWRWQRAFAGRTVDREAEWRMALDLLREEKRLLGDVPLVVVGDRRRLASFARETPGVRYLDLREAFAGIRKPLTFPEDGHWTPVAHAALAEALHARLAELLPGE
jgi:lysophospholipase L1-like esterase